MKHTFHILNGDALLERFPKSIQGDCLVMRECLIEGPVENKVTEAFYKDRFSFLNQFYGPVSSDDYQRRTVSEFDKMRNLPNDSIVNLWFEDDLFCQVNLWYVVHLLQSSHYSGRVFLIRPEVHDRYGFGGFSSDGLYELYEKKTQLTYMNQLSRLWPFYQRKELDKLNGLANKLKDKYPFIRPAVQAQIERDPVDGSQGRPQLTLLSIINNLNTLDFAEIFAEFNRREAIYGFGDSQVKRMLDKIIESQF